MQVLTTVSLFILQIVAQPFFRHLCETGVFDHIMEDTRYSAIRPADAFITIYVTGAIVLCSVLLAIAAMSFLSWYWGLSALAALVVLTELALHHAAPRLARMWCEHELARHTASAAH